ncbi:MAG: OsmC family protein [Firmicutes bacterium]|nr:OsmC family protein [Bacillota bacterium]
MDALVTWKGKMSFEGMQDGHTIAMDVPGDGRTTLGPKPKTLVLTALGGCTAVDVVSILEKMRVPLSGLDVHAEAELSGEHPKVFTSIHLTYSFKGTDLPLDKLQRAVSLSLDSYCGVSAMLAKGCPITHEIVVEAP